MLDNYDTLNYKILRCVTHLAKNFILDIINSSITLSKQDNSQSTYYSYKDLDNYIISESMSYAEFIRIVNILWGRFPVRIYHQKKICTVVSFSDDVRSNTILYNLVDRKIYLEII